MKFKATLNGQERELEVTRQGKQLRVHRDGETAELHLLHRDGPSFILEYRRPDGTHRHIRVAAHLEGEKRQLWVNGRTFTYQRIRERGGDAPDVAASLSASIPSVVSEVLVKEGERVTAGDKLILLESMKMVIPLQAPYDGIVKRLDCAAGDSVEPGVPLVEIEEISP